MEKRYVEIASRGLTLRGYLELPEGLGSGERAPLLVMFHGFGGTLSEKHFLLSRLSRRVVEAGVATLRLDFGGSGESDGTFADVTPLTEVLDGQAILGFGRSLPEVDPGRVGLLGFSLGGFVAACVAGREAAHLGLLVLVSAATGTHLKIERLLRETGHARRGALEVGEAFVRDGYALDPVASASAYGGPALVVQGTADAAVPPRTAECYHAALPGSSLVWVEGADHAYDSPELFEELAAAVVGSVRQL